MTRQLRGSIGQHAVNRATLPARALLSLLLLSAASQAAEIAPATTLNTGGVARSMDVSTDGLSIAIGRDDGAVVLVNSSDLSFAALVGAHTGQVRKTAYSHDDKKLLTASTDKTAKLWSIDSRTLIGTFTGHNAPVWAAIFSPDDTLAVSSGSDGFIRIWDTRTLLETGRLQGHTDIVRALAFSRDGRSIASGSDDHTIKIWDVDSLSSVQEFKGHEGKVWQVSFLPDGQLASSSSDGTVRLWDVDTGQEIRKLQAHTIGRNGKVRALAIHENVQLFVTGSEDHSSRIWSLKDWSYVATLIGHNASITAVVFAPDGTTLYSASNDETLRKWPAPATGSARVSSFDAEGRQ